MRATGDHGALRLVNKAMGGRSSGAKASAAILGFVRAARAAAMLGLFALIAASGAAAQMQRQGPTLSQAAGWAVPGLCLLTVGEFSAGPRLFSGTLPIMKFNNWRHSSTRPTRPNMTRYRPRSTA